MKKVRDMSSAELRERAERMLAAREAARPRRRPVEVQRLMHELQVHQLELEIQNDELRMARDHAEASLKRSTELFDFAPIGYLVLGAGRILEANLEASRMLGDVRAKLTGKLFAEFVEAPHAMAVVEFLGRVLARHGEEVGTELCEASLCHGGEPLEVRLLGSRLVGAEPRVLVAMSDITALRRAERALRDEAVRKDDFLAALSHELRNPLAPIRCNLELLQRMNVDAPERGTAMAVIDRQVEHLVRIVDDLLDVTRMARGKVQLRREHLELGPIVRRAIEDQRPDFEKSGISLDSTIAPEALWVDGDVTRIVQVIGNLLVNARKFTTRGGHVTVGLRREGDRALLTVLDDGVGIAPEVRARLFQPFTQAPQSLDRSRGGLGLGLAMVRGFVELHGGRVDASSAGIGRGSEFSVRLPLCAPGGAKAAPPPLQAPVARRRVLVIEDNEDSADTLRDLFALQGHEAQVAYDGATGLALARDFRPDVVICDIGLPGMDGYDVARAMRADEACKGSYLVALSGYARPEDRKRAVEAGFDYHLAKPPHPQDLRRVVATRPRLSATGEKLPT
jgi:two-component system CheB/CheR fusion protein